MPPEEPEEDEASEFLDLLDLVGYVEDNLTVIKTLVGPALDGDTIDHIVAACTYAKIRLDQLAMDVCGMGR